jgi:hypothetical protein
MTMPSAYLGTMDVRRICSLECLCSTDQQWRSRHEHRVLAFGMYGKAATVLIAGAMALAALTATSGCSVAESLRTEPGTDISSIQPGATRQQVEAVVGKPVRQWRTNLGVLYCVYQHYGGKDASYATATGQVFLNVATLGLAELLYQMDPEAMKRANEGEMKRAVIAVSYDAQDTVLGVFSDFSQFAVLPPDGRSAPKQAPSGASAPR